MSIEILLEKYLNKAFEIDITKLSNEDKVKYVQTINLLNGLLKVIEDIVVISKKIQESKELKGVI